MARRDPRTRLALRPAHPQPDPPSRRAAATLPDASLDFEGDGEDTFGWLGERLRRLSLGLAGMLFVARAYYPSEDAETGSGLIWVFAMLATVSLGVASFLFSGVTRLRWSWADAGVLALMLLVGLSTSRASERRAAITMAWEWAGLGMLYFLVRNLPRTRAESSALAASVVATAVALSGYAYYQVGVEIPRIRKMFQLAPDLVYAKMDITPGTPPAAGLEQRLMYSNEPFSTYALANSLAGFLVGPLVIILAVALENLKREGRGSRVVAYLMAAVPGLAVLVCLMLTKSRSAQIGLFVAVLALLWRARRVVPARVLTYAGVGGGVVFLALIAALFASRQLDVQVLTESNKSLRYRLEYWQGAWGVITDAPSPYLPTGLAALPVPDKDPASPERRSTFWRGLGPANFAGPYLGHKLPQASEEVQDPHNMVIEVWVTAGILAALVLLATLAIGLRDILGPPRPDPATVHDTSVATDPGKDPTAPPRRAGWLLAMSGLGWILVWVLGKLNPVVNDDLLARWLILGSCWGLAVLLGAALWRRREVPAAGLGLGVLALAINLLAAGGIGVPSVAMALWVLLALGLNFREDRPCGRLREVGRLGPAVALACVWAMLAGTFFGAVVPFWKSDAAIAEGDVAMAARPPAFEAARAAYRNAIAADHYDVRPWIALADLEYRYWRSPEGNARREPIWPKVLIAIDETLTPPRNPESLAMRRRQVNYARMILNELPERATVMELLHVKSAIVRGCRRAAMIYPTNAVLRADLAQASADIGYFPDAITEARQALYFDGRTPHKDKKLPDPLREYLRRQIPLWEKKASEPPPPATK